MRRCLKVSDTSETFVVTTENQKFSVYGQIEELELDVPKENILLEPEGKNTLPAICFGMREIKKRYGNSNVGIFSSDHILDINAMKTIADGVKLTPDHLVTYGVVPESPYTGYGYIKTGDTVDMGYEVSEFKEKPNLEVAKQYVKDDYLWNSGMFFFNTKLFESELQSHAPQMWNEFFNSDQDLNDIYRNIPSISVDYGLMETSDCVGVVRLDYKWSDLGTFDAMYNAFDKNEENNVIFKCLDACINSRRNLIHASKDKVVSLINVNDMIIVDTKDALLVCPRDSTQEVKDVVSRLKEQGDERVIIHQTVYRPWGRYTVHETSDKHKIKNIKVMPKKKLSLQSHEHRSEHWVVVKGKACVNVNNEQRCLCEGESTFISAGVKHRLFNPGWEPLEIIEVQLGESVGEDDIERFNDEYGRDIK